MTKAERAERDEARAKLAELLNPGDTVHTILRHVSKSGMSRSISVILPPAKGAGDGPWDASYLVARALGLSVDRNHYGVKIGGCGSDMGFEIVYNMGRALWPNGYTCTGEGCRSNDHSNGDRNYGPHHHQDGGYALRQRWL